MGLITSYLVYKSVSKPAVQQVETEDVLVAKANIAIGEALTPNHVKVTPWPKGTVVPGSLRTVKDIEGRVAKSSIVAGEPVLESKLTPPGGGGLMPVLVPPGKRAISIVVEQAVQKSGFVVPNSHVDVLVTMAQAAGAPMSRIVLQDITVLAADQTVEMKDNKPVAMTTVTMALTPEEAERLALAQNQGRVTLALRNVQDTDRVSTSGVTTAQLMGSSGPGPVPAKKATSKAPSATKTARKAAQPAPPAPVAQAAPVAQPTPRPTHTVAVIRGTTVAEETFVQDPGRGWVEAPKGGAAKKAQ